MKNSLIKFSSLILLASLISSCGTVFTGTTSNVSINTSNGKKVDMEVQSLSGFQKVTAPTSVIVKKGNSPIQVRVKDKCYEETSSNIPNKLNLVALINFLFGTFGTTSALVDVSNGAFWTYDTNVNVPVNKLNDKNC